ncbi:MAG: hypothetical protein OXR66_01610 [Candidatus Woesearchaeota archaeon]|nr:hypothetical protein [Candidatus Woesearchaeota archaeon]
MFEEYPLLLKGALSTGIGVLVFVCILAILTGLLHLLRSYFRQHSGIRKTYKFLLYLLTMAAVFALLIGWLIGIILPIVPGFVFLFLALVLIRKYYKHPWLEEKIRYLKSLRK